MTQDIPAARWDLLPEWIIAEGHRRKAFRAFFKVLGPQSASPHVMLRTLGLIK